LHQQEWKPIDLKEGECFGYYANANGAFKKGATTDSDATLEIYGAGDQTCNNSQVSETFTMKQDTCGGNTGSSPFKCTWKSEGGGSTTGAGSSVSVNYYCLSALSAFALVSRKTRSDQRI
jgi:hypothetical protein